MPNTSSDLQGLLATLTEQEKVLIVCTAQLYDGRWDLIVHDLVARLEGRPFVFRLGEQIKEDLARVKRLQKLEEEHGVRLAEFVTL